LFATKVCWKTPFLHHSGLTFTQIWLLCNYVIDNLCSHEYYQGGSIFTCLSQIQSRWGGLDFRIDNGEFLKNKLVCNWRFGGFRIDDGEFLKNKIGLQLKVRWVVVALNGLQHISHWNKQIFTRGKKKPHFTLSFLLRFEILGALSKNLI
jgi:nitrite reductase/ring-hydroxylating ferredoxin subunit